MPQQKIQLKILNSNKEPIADAIIDASAVTAVQGGVEKSVQECIDDIKSSAEVTQEYVDEQDVAVLAAAKAYADEYVGLEGGVKGEKGDPGEAATVAVGTTVTTEPGTPASVVNVGTPNAAIFDFSIPRGADGNSGEGGGVRLYIGTEENPVIMSSLPAGFCGISGVTKSNPNATGSNATLNFTTEYWGTIDRSGTLTYFTTFISMAWRVYSYYISGNNAIGQDSLPLRDIVRTNGSQTIGGVKTFSNPPESASTPVNGNQLTNKSYVDSLSPGGGGIPSVVMTGEAAAIDPNTEYIWGETDALHITLNAPVNGIRNEYMFQFTSGIRATDLTVDGDVLWVGGSPRISAETIYRASIINGIGSMIGVDISEGSPAQRWLDGVTVGWNLAGSLESTGSNYHKDKIGTPEEVPFFETMWGNPMTTKDMLRMVQDKGFNMIRIPITWSQHLDTDFRISENWMDRVQEIVDWCVDLGLKCTINTHHDHSPYGDGKDWLWADPSTLSTVLPHLATVWTQIAERFRDYPTDLLAFEGYNELMTKARTWAAPTAAEYDALNQIAQKFVDVVRATGGNNATRILSINTYGCMLVNLQYFKMPYDSANGCLFAQVHYYDVKTNQEVESDLAVLDTYFKDKGIPLFIGEIGTEYTDDYRLRIMAARNLISRTREHGYRCAWWDHGVWMLLDRFKMSWLVPELADALIEGSQVSPADQDYISDHTYTSISQFEYGALNIDDGSRTTHTLGALRFPQPIEVTPGYEYIVSAVYSDQGFKVPYLFWYDSDNTYLGYTKPNPSTSYSLVVTFAPVGAKYLNIYFYNPWRTITESGYASMLSSGELSLRIAEAANDTPDMPSQPINNFDFNAFSSWRSGNYVPVRRDFEDDPAQLSIIMPVECRMATEYRFNVSDDDVGITVRELDIHKNMVFEHAYVKDGSYFPTDKRTHYLMLQLFRVSEPAAYGYFQDLFSAGFTVSVTEAVNPAKNASGYFPIETLDLNDYANYKTGTYSKGIFANAFDVYHKICLSAWVEVNPSTLYSLTIADGFALEVQEMSGSKAYVRASSNMTSGSMLVTDATTKYLAVTLYYYDKSAFIIQTDKTQRDFINSFKSGDLNCSFAISDMRSMVLKKSQGTAGSAVSASTGLTYSGMASAYCLFDEIDVSALTNQTIMIDYMGSLVLAQYDENGAVIPKPDTYYTSTPTLFTLEPNTKKIRFASTWMSSTSQLIFAYYADEDIQYV